MKRNVKTVLWVNGILVALLLCCLVLSGWISSQLYSIRTANRWKGESALRFSQISCFFPVNEKKSEADIRVFRSALDQKMMEASLEQTSEAKIYSDAYSGTGRLTVKSEHGTASLSAYGVGGNFFLFHPLRLLSGSYLSEMDLMKDRIVLDELAAWQLFGSPDVAGKTVWINGSPFYVAGVVERETDYASKQAMTEGAGFFLHYATLNQLSETPITCYEVVMPDPVKNFASETVTQQILSGSLGQMRVNSGRYSIRSLSKTLREFEKTWMTGSGIEYPYWEQAVRLTELHLMLLLILAVSFAMLPVVTVIVMVIIVLIRIRKRTKGWLSEKISGFIEKKKETRYKRGGE